MRSRPQLAHRRGHESGPAEGAEGLDDTFVDGQSSHVAILRQTVIVWREGGGGDLRLRPSTIVAQRIGSLVVSRGIWVCLAGDGRGLAREARQCGCPDPRSPFVRWLQGESLQINDDIGES